LTVRPVEFQLPRAFFFFYAAIALLLSVALLDQSLRRGAAEFSWWLLAYAALAVFCLRRPQLGPLAAGFLAFLLGWVKTYRGGFNLDLGLGLLALAVGLHVLSRVARDRGGQPVDLAGLLLLAIATWSLVSVAFTLARIRSFVPAPGFGYRPYQFNAQGFSSEEAIVRTTIGATATFVWWGLYEYARRLELNRRLLNVAVFLALLANTAVLVVQRFANPHFLHPDDLGLIGRLNGVTSFCYALGDAALALFLLLPVWGSPRGVPRVLTMGSIFMLAYAVVASGSRTALLTMFVASVLWAGLRVVRSSGGGRRYPAYLSLAAVVVLLALGMVAYMETPADHATPLGRLKFGIERYGFVGLLFETRLNSYPLILRVIREYPISGVGAGVYLAEVSKQHALLVPQLRVTDPYLLGSYAPNQFLNVGVELGLPAMVALVVVFASALATAIRQSRPPGKGSAELVISVLALAAALQLGPGLYNSEALVFFWLVIGLAGPLHEVPGSPVEPTPPRTVGPSTTTAVIAGALVVGLVGQLLSLPSLAVIHQWARLRWRLGMGLLPSEAEGRWTRPEATFVVDSNAPAVTVRWHAGDRAAPNYSADVSFYVDGALVERSLALSGHVRESTLPLPAVPGYKRISIRVSPPFVPGAASGASDRRQLGIFIHSVSAADVNSARSASEPAG
jgi:hypothetical protein